MLKKIQSIHDKIDLAVFAISSIVLVIVSVMATVFRYVISKPIMWAEEVEMILILWAVFSGGSLAFSSGGHIAIDVLYDRFPKKMKFVVDVINWFLVAFSIGWISFLQFKRTRTFLRGHQTTTILKIPRSIVFMVVAILCVSMIVSHVIRGVETLILRKEDN